MDRQALRRWLPVVLGATVLALALTLLHRELRTFSVAEILAGLRALPVRQMFGAVAFTAASFLTLTGYDWLAARYVGADVPYRRLAFASFIGHAFSQSLGFSLLTGAPVRFRLYTAWGVEAPDIARIIAFSTATFWVGFLALAGVAFAVDPPGLPQALAFLGSSARPLGALLVTLTLAYLGWCRWGGSEIRIRGWSLPTPSVVMGVQQILVSALDWAASAAALYVLLPSGTGLSFPTFLAAYLLAQIVGLVSHVPGGLGVFEIVLLVALREHAGDSSFVTSLLAFRAIYYLLPLVLAAGALGAFEFRRRQEHLGRIMALLGSGLSSTVPVVAAGAVFVAGAVMLAEGALPLQGHLGSLAEFLPLGLLEASHFLGSVVGALLLILAWGLARRLDGAFHAALALLGAGAVLSAFRGGGMVTAMVSLAVLIALAPARREFFRRSALLAEPLSPEWVFGVVAVLLATAWLGLFAFKEVAYSGDLWWQFALKGDAPRFLRSSVGAATVLLAFAGARLLRPAEAAEAEPAPEAPGDVAALVTSSDRAHAALAHLGDKSFLVSESGRAFIMYGVEGRSWVSMGDPVGDPEDFPELVWKFRNRVNLHGGWPAFYQVRPEFLPLYVDAGLTLIKLGEEAVVATATFSMEGGHRSGMRRTLRKIEKDGGVFEIIPREAVPAELPRLRAVSDAWLEAKSTREKAFSLGSFTEEYIARFPVAVVRVEGRIIAFANLWLAAPGTEYSVDLMRYDPDGAPADCMEYLFLKLILWGQEQGYARFGLGMAPLAGLESGPLSPLWAKVGAAVYRYGEHFYNFQGLRAFKDKFDPVWEPRYLASPGGTALPRVLAGISSLVSGSLRGALTR